MKYKDWAICDLKVTDDLWLKGSANRMGARFEFRIELTSFLLGDWEAFCETACGISDRDAEKVALDFVDEKIRGAAQSVIESARDRLNDYIYDDLEGDE